MRRGARLRVVSTWIVLLLIAVPGAELRAEPTRESSLDVLEWHHLSPLPDPIGFAGPFAGVSGDALIVAGGANFPGGRPWDGHPKIWHDRIFVLEEPSGRWRSVDARLPRPLGYGVSLTWHAGNAVVCVGGGDAERHYADAFLLRWLEDRVVTEPLPPLPVPMAFGSGVMIEDTVFVLGGTDAPDAVECLSGGWALDLSERELRWRSLPLFPGAPRQLAIAGALNGSVYLFGGVGLELDDGGKPRRIDPYFRDAYRFTPTDRAAPPTAAAVEGRWQRIADLPTRLAGAPSPALAIGPSHLYLISGDDGGRGGVQVRDAHPGFVREILAYHALTDRWAPAGRMPEALGGAADRGESVVHPPVTTTVVSWRGNWVVPSGEIRPGVRTRQILAAKVSAPRSGIGGVSLAVLVGYLLALVAMGFYFSRRERTTDDFFLGGRRVPWWAAGLSIFGTQLSAITFLAIPAKTYATDWLYFVQNLGIVAVAPLIVWICLPFYRRLDVTSVYEYLEHRFHVAHRLFGASAFVLFQLARMGIVLYLPALALAAVTGLDIVWCIVAMGVLCTLYTVLGGIEAVIWTDVLQVGVLLGGAATALVVVLTGVDGGFETVRETAAAHDKFRLVDLRWDWTGPAIGVILLGAVFNNLVPYAGDQAVVQRYLTTADQKQAARAVWTGALMAIPASLLFFFVGTALFVFYSVHPERLDPVGANDQIFAWFIARELPVGVAGLVIAGVFAAAMSSLDSSMNSIAAVLTTDVYRRFGAPRSDVHYLRFARGITLILGVVGTLTALWLAGANVKSLWDVFLGAIGLLGGTMSGLLILGMVSTRAHATGAAIGAVASLAALLTAKWSTELSSLLYAAIGMVTCIGVGHLASLLVPGRTRELTGLTLFTRPES